MKKVRRIIALVGVIALVALYVSTLVLAIIGSEMTMNLFWAAVVFTIVLPVLIWAYQFIYRLLKENYSPEAREREEELKKAYKKSQEADRGEKSEAGEAEEDDKQEEDDGDDEESEEEDEDDRDDEESEEEKSEETDPQ